MNHIFVKLQTAIDGHPSGQIVRLVSDKNGTPVNSFWRKRIKDSKTDDCLSVLKKAPKKGFVNAPP